MLTQIIQGDSVRVLKTLPPDSVHCVVTSVPYWNLRSYLPEDHPDKPLEIGSEPTPEAWAAKLVELLQEVKRVLHPSGVAFVNCGDAYVHGVPGEKRQQPHMDGREYDCYLENGRIPAKKGTAQPKATKVDGLKEKNLLGLPWRLAFALQSDGWILRSEITWIKKSPMPESCTDRPTNATEKVFLLAKNPDYFYDAFAVREKQTGNAHSRGDGLTPKTRPESDRLVKAKESFHTSTAQWHEHPDGTRNMRNYMILGSEPYPGEHYATFPTALPRRCILAGTSARGVCPRCLAPWDRIIEEGEPIQEQQRRCGGDADGNYFGQSTKNHDAHGVQNASDVKRRILAGMVSKKTVGWIQTCRCGSCSLCGEDAKHGLCEGAGIIPFEPVPSVVLDPFAGTFTTCAVALELGRASIGIELSEESCRQGRERIDKITPGFPNFG